MKKAGIFLLCVSAVTLALLVSSVRPEQANILRVSTYHEYIDGVAHCRVEIDTYTTTMIDNVSVELCLFDNDQWITLKRWENVPVEKFELGFYETVEHVERGYTYRLTVSADVCRDGKFESASFDHDVKY